MAEIDFGENVYDVNFVRSGSDEDLLKLIMEIGKFSNIWGQDSGEPLIYITNILVSPSKIRIMGANQDTVRIDYNGMTYIKFHASDLIEKIKNQTETFRLDIIGKANLNEWCGRLTPQIFIENYDIKQI